MSCGARSVRVWHRVTLGLPQTDKIRPEIIGPGGIGIALRGHAHVHEFRDVHPPCRHRRSIRTTAACPAQLDDLKRTKAGGCSRAVDAANAFETTQTAQE